MDVQAVAPTLSSTTFAPPTPTGAGDPSAVPAAPAPVAPVGDGSSSGSTPSAVPQNAGLALLPPSGGSGTSSGTGTGSGSGSGSSSLSGNVAKVYNLPDQQVQVSFQTAPGSSEVVTVFTDKSTGKVIVQFPSETLIALAQFFQKLDNSADNGAVVDKKV
jgi:hypothetical protein